MSGRSGSAAGTRRRVDWGAMGGHLVTAACVAVVLAAAAAVAPRLLAYETYIVRSGSMEPAIRTGSLVVVQPVRPRELKTGDVISYRRPEVPGTVITHRIVALRLPEDQPNGGPIIRTKGDANATADPWEIQLQGTAWREVFSAPLVGYLFAFAQEPAGRLLFLAIPGVALAAFWLERGRRRWQAWRRRYRHQGAPRGTM